MRKTKPKKPSKKLVAAIYLHAFNILSDEAMKMYRLHMDISGGLKHVKQLKNGDIVIDVKKLNRKKK